MNSNFRSHVCHGIKRVRDQINNEVIPKRCKKYNILNSENRK